MYAGPRGIVSGLCRAFFCGRPPPREDGTALPGRCRLNPLYLLDCLDLLGLCLDCLGSLRYFCLLRLRDGLRVLGLQRVHLLGGRLAWPRKPRTSAVCPTGGSRGRNPDRAPRPFRNRP